MGAPFTLANPSEQGSAPSGRSGDFAEPMHQLRDAGLLERRRSYYLTKIAVTGGLFVAAWAAIFVMVGDSWWQLVVAAFLASPRTTRVTSCADRYSPPATCAVAGWLTSPSAG